MVKGIMPRREDWLKQSITKREAKLRNYLICWRSPFLAGIDGHGEVTRLLLIDFPGFRARSIVGWIALNLFPAIFGCFESRKNCWSNLLWMNVPM